MIARQLASLAAPERRDARRTLLALDGQGDTRPLTDLRASLPQAIAAIGLFSVGVTALTAAPSIGPGYATADLVVLLAFQLISTALVWRLPWWRVSETWLVAAIGLQVVFVGGVVTLTGGSTSPFVALYAPVLAVAGWYLRGSMLALTYALVLATEVWRAVMLDPLRSLQPIEVPLPVYGLVGLLGWMASRWATTAAVGSRRDQVRTAATLHAMRAIAVRGREEPVAALVGVAGRALVAEAWLAPDEVGAGSSSHSCRQTDRFHIEVAMGGIGILHFCRAQQFSANEHRLAGILAGAIHQASDYAELAQRCSD